MPDTWQQTYACLKNSLLHIPTLKLLQAACHHRDVRPEFYGFSMPSAWDSPGVFPEELIKIYELSRRWSEVSRTVIESMALEDIEVTAPVKWF